MLVTLQWVLSWLSAVALTQTQSQEFDELGTLFRKKDSIFRGLCEQSNVTERDIHNATKDPSGGEDCSWTVRNKLEIFLEYLSLACQVLCNLFTRTGRMLDFNSTIKTFLRSQRNQALRWLVLLQLKLAYCISTQWKFWIHILSLS